MNTDDDRNYTTSLGIRTYNAVVPPSPWLLLAVEYLPRTRQNHKVKWTWRRCFCAKYTRAAHTHTTQLYPNKQQLTAIRQCVSIQVDSHVIASRSSHRNNYYYVEACPPHFVWLPVVIESNGTSERRETFMCNMAWTWSSTKIPISICVESGLTNKTSTVTRIHLPIHNNVAHRQQTLSHTFQLNPFPRIAARCCVAVHFCTINNNNQKYVAISLQ